MEIRTDAANYPRVGVVLAGCGELDGTQIHETVLVMVSLDRHGAAAIFAAPDMDQRHVMNHLKHEETSENRHVRVESARLARGHVADLPSLAVEDLDALLLPGGHGAIQHLSDFALRGPGATVHPVLRRLIEAMHQARKPIGAISTASLSLVKALGSIRPSVTIGKDSGTVSAIQRMGGCHQVCDADQIHADKDNRIVTTPGFMEDTGIAKIATGIDKMVRAVLSMIDRPQDQ